MGVDSRCLTDASPSFFSFANLLITREIVSAEVQHIIVTKHFRPALRDLLLWTIRFARGKGLRPSLCLAACPGVWRAINEMRLPQLQLWNYFRPTPS